MPNIFGIADVEFRTISDESTIAGVLQTFGNDLQTALIESLNAKKAPNTSGNLQQTILFNVEFLGQAWEFDLRMDQIGDFINEGVGGIGDAGLEGNDTAKNYPKHQTSGKFNFKRGSRPSARHFDVWARSNGMSPFAVRESVWRKGIKPNHFYDEVVTEQLIDDLTLKVEKAGARMIAVTIANTAKTKQFKGTVR